MTEDGTPEAPQMPEKRSRRTRRSTPKQEKAPETLEIFAEGGVVDGSDAVLGRDDEPEAVIPAEKVVEKAEEEAPKAKIREDIAKIDEKTPVEDVTPDELPPDMDRRGEIARIICVKKGKRDVPTLVTYYSRLSRAERSVMIDVNRNLLKEAWDVYGKNCPNPDPEAFLATVLDILKHDFPRIYRTVAQLTLD